MLTWQYGRAQRPRIGNCDKGKIGEAVSELIIAVSRSEDRRRVSDLQVRSAARKRAYRAVGAALPIACQSERAHHRSEQWRSATLFEARTVYHEDSTT